MAKKKEVRQNQIYQLLVDNGRMRIKDLADQLHVTTETLRTDLVDLEKQRRVVREHGYAIEKPLVFELCIWSKIIK